MSADWRNRRCDTCDVWQRLADDSGECRVNPPADGGVNFGGRWPLTLPDQFCGRWRPPPVVQTPRRPTVVLLCGSTRFRREYEEAFRREEHAGRICLTVPCYKDDPCCKTAEGQAALDALHLAKLALADEVLVIDPGGYVGESTRNEIAHARKLGKRLRWLEMPEGGAT